MNFGFIIDNRKCIGCHACTVACKAEHDVPVGVNRTWVKYIEKGEFPHTRRLFSVMRCNHCEDAPCVEICPVSALFTRSDGIVDFDNRRCIACKACMQACPYDALFIDPQTETAAKCNYCAHRVEIGLEPSCVIVCPEHAIISGDMDDPDTEIAQLLAREQVTARKVEKGTRPKLFYIEGDHASLNPTATEESDAYMWSSQSAGVGHFAKYAEARIAKSDKMDEGDHAVLIPDDDAKTLEKARDVLKEQTRRVYDTPSEGAVWGWEVAAYILTKAVAAGGFLVAFVAALFNSALVTDAIQWSALVIALVFLTLTGALLVKDLDQPKRFLYVILRPQWRSWLVRGAYAITVYGFFLTLIILAKLLSFSFINMLVWPTAALAIITAVYTAFLFAQAKGRDFWQSPLLPFHMLIHALVAGGAGFGILSFIYPEIEWTNFLEKLLLLTILLNLAIIAVDLLTTHATEDAKRAVQIIVSGRFRNLFWLGGIVVGNLIPVLMLLFTGSMLLPVVGILVLIGIYCIEYAWVRAPQLIPLS